MVRGEAARRMAAATVALGVGLATLFAVTAAQAETTVTNETIVNPAVSEELVPLAHGRTAEQGSLSYVLYRTRFGWKPYVYVRDTASTTVAHVALPEDPAAPGRWDDASYAVSPAGELWTLSGSGPVLVRRYRFSGGSVPTTAALVSTTTFGDADSRAGGLVVLASGNVVGVWHQQGTTGGNGLGVAYWNGTTWTTTMLDFMPTMASKQAVVQHPGDGSVWLFNDPDAWHAIGAAHLTETPAGLTVDWTDPTHIDVPTYGAYGPDSENPDIEAAADPSTGTVVLAYQGDVRRTFSTSPVVTGSYPVIARIPASGSLTFVSFPTWVERISALGVIARPGEVRLAYRPIDQATLTFADVYRARYDTTTATWDAPVRLGTSYGTYDRIGFGVTRMELTVRMGDAKIHRFSPQPVPNASTTTSTTTTTSSTTTKSAKKPRR